MTNFARLIANYQVHSKQILDQKPTKFVVDGGTIGLILPRFAAPLQRHLASSSLSLSAKFSFSADSTIFQFNSAVVAPTFDARSAAIDELLASLKALKDAGKLDEELTKPISKWRGEKIDVVYDSQSNPSEAVLLFNIERGGLPLFGIPQYCVQINVYTGDGHLWVARRSATKPTFPGMLDNCVGGGIPSGEGWLEATARECLEEAGIPMDWTAANIKFIEPISSSKNAMPLAYMTQTSYGINAEVLFCFDLYVQKEFVPRVCDGEVDQFYCWSAEQVSKAVVDDEFCDGCDLVTIDFLQRHHPHDVDSSNVITLPPMSVVYRSSWPKDNY